GHAHSRGGERRHLRRRPDRGGTPLMREHTCGPEGTLAATCRGPLWRVQWVPVPGRDRTSHLRFRALQQYWRVAQHPQVPGCRRSSGAGNDQWLTATHPGEPCIAHEPRAPRYRYSIDAPGGPKLNFREVLLIRQISSASP